MRLAQTLYEGIELPSGETSGLITYMRTDSVRIASEAVHRARTFIEGQIGEKYLPASPRHYKKKGKTQDAHEAIRPTDVSRTPEQLKDVLDKPLWKLYDLIWRRFVASQMADSVAEVTIIEIEGDDTLFRARGQERLFDGFQRVYPVESENGERLPPLPVNFAPGYPLHLQDIEAKQHFTQPPPRYTEATLVKAMDELGIGRPSTYATIISTLFDREYVIQMKRKLSPTELGETVNKISVELFPDIFEVGFTARMEEELDNVEGGKAKWVEVVEDFYGPFSKSLEQAEGLRSDIKKKVEEVSDQTCEKCGRPMVVKWGRRGKFLACSGFPECKNAKPLEAPEEIDKPCPSCGGKLQIKQGKYGRFLGCSNYPKCRHIESINTGIKCPQIKCDGDIVERGSKKGRFWGCSNYPKCKFRVYKQPEPISCNNCEHPFMVREGSQGEASERLTCPKCKHTVDTLPETEAA
jgi:DNA topoisomerase-1